MEEHRLACQRQHRVLGHFLAIQAWLRGVDCLVLERDDLEAFLGLKRFKEERVRWLQADLRPWFPYQVPLEQGTSRYSLHSLYLSRLPIDGWLSTERLETAQRLAQMSPESPKTVAFSETLEQSRLLKEGDVVKYLALLDSGLVVPQPYGKGSAGEL